MSTVIVVGGAVLDGLVTTRANPVLATSNPARAVWTPGGVGRNIAENIARLGGDVELVAPVGADAAGEQILGVSAAAGVGISHVVQATGPTGVYLAVLDPGGDLVIGCSDMSATDMLRPDDLAHLPPLLEDDTVLVADANLPAAVMTWLLDLASERGVRVVLEPVSVAKAALMAPCLHPDRPVLAITPNVDELAALVGARVPDDPVSLAAACTNLHDRGVGAVWVSRGRAGSLLSVRTGAQGDLARTLTAPPAQVVDVTGAGDSMTAAFSHVIARGGSLRLAAQTGAALASLTVESPHTVRPDLTQLLVEQRLADHPVVVEDVSL